MTCLDLMDVRVADGESYKLQWYHNPYLQHQGAAKYYPSSTSKPDITDLTNEANGWNNTDGDNNSRSWNCGAEGETDNPGINELRRKLCKNAFAVLMCSRGPAMFYAGDEFCNTQFGNNNAYCQDNEISWLDWDRKDRFKDVYNFARFMINFRRWHPVLRHRTKPALCGYPDISMHNGSPWNAGYGRDTRQIGIMYAGRNENDTADDIIYIGINTYWEPRTVQIPPAPEGFVWQGLAATSQKQAPLFGQLLPERNNSLTMGARSVIIAIIEKKKTQESLRQNDERTVSSL